MKKNSFIMILIFFITLQSVWNEENHYKNSEVGFSLNYPKNVFLASGSNNNDKNSDRKLKLFITYQKVDDLEDMPSGYDKANIIAERERLTKGDNSGIIDWPTGKELIQIDNKKNGKVFCVFSRYEVQDIVFFKETIFFIGEYVVFITLDASDFKEEIIKNMPSFFDKNENNYSWKVDGDTDSIKNFYENLKSGKSVGIAQEWFNTFDEILKSIKIYSIFLTPTIRNLRFRSSPDLKGKIIRKLKKDERLELLEKGKTETIQGDKGTWLKVITDKGEIGWCFDAYLEKK